MTSRITFISHAETPALRTSSFPADESLEERTLLKIQAIQWAPPRAQNVLVAPEQRAQMTATGLGLVSQVDEGLRDCNYGSWQGRGLEDVQEDDPAGLLTWLTDSSGSPHGGESLAVLAARVGRWLASRADDGHTIAVTHPAIIRCAIVSALGSPLEAFWRIDIAPLSLTDLRHNGRQWTLRMSSCPLANANRHAVSAISETPS